MYSVVNHAIQGMIVENFGEDTWKEVKAMAGGQPDVFADSVETEDIVTYQTVLAVSEALSLPLSEVLTILGEYWILKVADGSYGPLLMVGGRDLKDFLVNIPNFHSRIMIMFPDYVPPEFRTSDVGERSVLVHYFSVRSGLTDFVGGMLLGVTKMYHTEANIEKVQAKEDGFGHDIFSVNW